MAEVIVSAVFESLAQVIRAEVPLLQGYRREVNELSNDLKYLMTLLKDAEERQYGDVRILNWVSEIRELAYDIEDVLYMFNLKVQRKPGCFQEEVCCVEFYGSKEIVRKAWTEIKTEMLVNLRELWLGGPLKGLLVFSFDSMSNLTSLRILSVELGHDDDSFGSLQPLSHCHHLVELRLRGKM
ncbi:hypothetical protein QYF36_008470 [Acer negundo]|nr:hypothetical protein QYF36_008470 [Acer negundo]